MRFRILAGLLCLIPVLCGTATAAERRVPQDVATLRLALDLSAPGDTVIVSPGVYTDHDLNLPGGVTLRGAGDATATVIDAGGIGRVIQAVETAVETTRLGSLTLTGGSEAAGGGLFAFGMTGLEILDCIFVDNTASLSGGGACVDSCHDVLVDGCRFLRNSSESGGGLLVSGGSGLTIAECLFQENTAVVSAGVGIGSTREAQLDRCLFVDNACPELPSHFSAGLLADTVVLTHCTFVGGGPCALGVRFGVISVSCSVFQGSGSHWVEEADALYACNLYDQSWGPGVGTDGNRWGDPCFCDPEAGDYTLAADSNALPDASSGCGLAGAFDVGCGDMGCRLVVNEDRSWGGIKRFYR